VPVLLRPPICLPSHQLHHHVLLHHRPAATVPPRTAMGSHHLRRRNPITAMDHHPKMAMENPHPGMSTCHQEMEVPQEVEEVEEEEVERIYPSSSWSPRSTQMVLIR